MALGELGCPSLDYVYEMTWAEFMIRLYAYNRQQKKEWYKVREICYQIYTSNWMDSKRKPVSKERYMPLEGTKVNKPNEKMLERIKQVQKEYHEQVKRKNG